MTARKEIIVSGQVQGVGFRPFVYRTAVSLGLSGFVLNSSEGVKIEIQGDPQSVTVFTQALENDLPPLARVVKLQKRDIPPLAKEDGFKIGKSDREKGHQVLISPDVCTCDDCLRELFDPNDRRYLYPFINCTNCGPRYTITRSIPYDRPQTSMACFPMCPECHREYEDPLDRRFHAQPNACGECGPHIWLADRKGRELCFQHTAVQKAVDLLLKGKVLAVKGLGGFHLACDARDSNAVLALRRRKNRPGKALAVMVGSAAHAAELARVSPEEEALLTSPQRPIVVLEKRGSSRMSPHIAPDTNSIGIMLPYTPLHFVLFSLLESGLSEGSGPPVLVMTSGNSSSEPIALGNREALARLSAIADYFLLHNRDILVRCDDSVVYSRFSASGFYRRARGYTPVPIFLASSGDTVLGTGPELKNTLCLTKGDQAFVSQHVGDLKNLESYDFFLEMFGHLQKILQVEPRVVVRDLHPDYMSSRFAMDREDCSVYALQHHFAHIHAVMAENRFQGVCLGLALDGTGLGEDGTIWGGELLLVDNRSLEHTRLGSFTPLPLPGGEMAVLEPWRMARSFLYHLDMDVPAPWTDELGREDQLLLRVLEKGVNCPLSSSCGRLFDALSALLGLAVRIDYEGQAAVRLEKIQDTSVKDSYLAPVYRKHGFLYLSSPELFAAAVRDVKEKADPGVISRRFHLGLAEGLAGWAAEASADTGVRDVALSGGVMQNLTLFCALLERLESKGLRPLVHSLLPANDGCISLGQAAFGQRLLQLGADRGRRSCPPAD
ncbi:MAG: carbamoyltransferase HypF [Desulfonatronovibrionaceae bacterium]